MIPGRSIFVDNIRVRGVGQSRVVVDEAIEKASGPPKVELVSDVVSCF